MLAVLTSAHTVQFGPPLFVFVGVDDVIFPRSLLTRLTLHKEGGRYYISYQEDFFHPDVSKFCLIGVVMGPS